MPIPTSTHERALCRAVASSRDEITCSGDPSIGWTCHDTSQANRPIVAHYRHEPGFDAKGAMDRYVRQRMDAARERVSE